MNNILDAIDKERLQIINSYDAAKIALENEKRVMIDFVEKTTEKLLAEIETSKSIGYTEDYFYIENIPSVLNGYHDRYLIINSIRNILSSIGCEVTYTEDELENSEQNPIINIKW